MTRLDSTGFFSGKLLAVAFAAVVGSFFAMNVIVDRSSRTVGELAESIIYNTAPSIEVLARVRKSVLESEVTLIHDVEDGTSSQHKDALDAALRDADESVRAYLQLEPTPGEHPLMLAVQAGAVKFQEAVRDVRAVARTDHAAALDAFVTQVEPARRQLLEAVTSVIEHNAVRGREAAMKIRAVRERARRLEAGLTIACIGLSVVVALLLNRELRARRELLQAHLKDAESRAEELEQFAGRVAHDIRNPISVGRAAAELAIKRSVDDTSRALMERIVSGLTRADAITSALFEFARAGSKPDPGAHTEVESAVRELVEGVRPEAEEAGVTLKIEAVENADVACSNGVYFSVLGNLVRNAIKYIGDGPTKEIAVSALIHDKRVRTEVRDTGPGIAEEKLARIFEPFFRGHRGRDGLGLGLATVKKLVEGHGGAVGVESAVGRGSTFWFELPRA
jgi:signal transduction histidine kinase